MFWFRYCAIYSTDKKKKAKQENPNPEPFGEVVLPAKLQAIRLHSRTLGEFKVSLLLLCEYLVSQCKPLQLLRQ